MRQLITALVIAVAAIIFALQNAGPVNVRFFFWELSNTSLALVLVITLIIGIITGLLMKMGGIMSRNSQISELRKKVSELEAKLKSTSAK